ncbi:transmembrane prediction [soil metagenome]
MSAPAAPPTSEQRQSLWWIAASPLIWFGHFLVSYIAAAIWCAKAGDAGATLQPVRLLIAVLTVLALGGIAAVGAYGYRRQSYGSGHPPHDMDTPADRHRFLGFATTLLSGLSAIATLFVAGVALFIHDCH